MVVDDVDTLSRKSSTKGNKLLLGILSILMAAIIGLTVGLVAVINRKAEMAKSPTNTEDHPSQENAETSGTINEFENVREEIDEIEGKISALPNPNTDQIIAIYQEYVEKSEDINKKAGLLRQRIIELQKDNLGRDYSEQVIADSIAIDDLLKSLGSAAQVMNVASLYGDMDVFYKYQTILSEREVDAGVDTSMETEG